MSHAVPVQAEAEKPAYDLEKLSQFTQYKSYLLRGGQGLLCLLIINDIYKRRVAQGAAHIYCLGMMVWLHNAIWVKDLEELVPVLGTVAQQYSEELDNLTEEVGKLTEQRQAFAKQNSALMQNLARHEEIIQTDLKDKAAQFQKLQSLEQEKRKSLELLEGRIQGLLEAQQLLQRKLGGTTEQLSEHTAQLREHAYTIINKDDPLFLIEALKTSLAAKQSLPQDVRQDTCKTLDQIFEKLTKVLQEPI